MGKFVSLLIIQQVTNSAFMLTFVPQCTNKKINK
uniref:Uncharacterized protein n=1 Tax=Arundo donax TaxID=35708 RepID=A0A0A8ZIV9_ARUDO